MKKKNLKAFKKQVKRTIEHRKDMTLGLMRDFSKLARKFVKKNGRMPSTFEALMDAHLVMAGISFRYLVQHTIYTAMAEALQAFPEAQHPAIVKDFEKVLGAAVNVATGASTEPLQDEIPTPRGSQCVPKSKKAKNSKTASNN